MTAQFAESLKYQGKKVAMATNPLCDYFTMGGSRPDFAPSSTALRRRYMGSWEIVNDRLYLIGLTATLNNGSKASLTTLFPEFPDRVFAHWFSGIIRIPQGGLLEYVHMGYASSYERDAFLDLERGVVIGTRVQHNMAVA